LESEALIVADDEHDDEEKLHNSDEKLHNSTHTPDADADQPAETEPYTYVVDLGDEQIYYYRDEKGKLHSYDFLQEDLIFSAEDFSEEELRKAEKMKRIEADLDIVKIVRTSEEAEKGITIPAPQPGEARDLRVHVSTKAGPANLAIVAKRAGEPSSNCDSTAISEHDRLSPAVTSAGPDPSDTDMEVPLTFSFTLEELDA
jgi:hypothetical protein